MSSQENLCKPLARKRRTTANTVRDAGSWRSPPAY